MIKKGLGKGLGALISDEGSPGVIEIRINDIEPNANQPRKNFNDEKLSVLSESIKEHGVVQPIIVRKEEDTYRIVAGERRWRAARLAGLAVIPAIVKDISNKQVMEIALIENIQREDLNPIEEAEAFDRLIKEFNMTQDQLSKAVGRSRSAITNSLRLMSLADDVKTMVVGNELTSGHARTLIVVEDRELQIKLAKEIIAKDLNVRQTEGLIKKVLTKNTKKKTSRRNEYLQEIEQKLQGIFGTKVELVSGNKKGKIMIEYYSNDELQRILDIIGDSGKN